MAASLISYQGRFIDITLVAWLVVQATDSPLSVALVTTFRFLPFLLTGPFLGAVMDRLPPLRIIRAAQASSALLAASMAVVAALTGVDIWLLYGYAFFAGMAWTLEISTRRALIRQTVGSSGATSGIALEFLAWYSGAVVGANIGGVLASRVSDEAMFGLLSALYAATFAVMLAVRAAGPPSQIRTHVSPVRLFNESLRIVRGSRMLVAAFVLMATAEMFGFGFESLTPLFAVDVLGAGSIGLGLLISASGIGALLATIVIATLGQRTLRHGTLLIGATAGLGIVSIVFASSTSLPASLVILVAAGAIGNMYAVMSGALILMKAPEESSSGLIGIHFTMIGMFPVGAVVIGLLANEIGPRSALGVTGLISLGITLTVALLAPELRKPTTDSAEDEPPEGVAQPDPQSPG